MDDNVVSEVYAHLCESKIPLKFKKHLKKAFSEVFPKKIWTQSE